MFRVIFGMADEKKKVLDTLYNYARTLATHVIKCVVYGNSTGDYDHWLQEITNYIWDANNLKPKKGTVIRPVQYQTSLFAWIGDEPNDAHRELKTFKRLRVKTGDYPEFEITQNLYFNLYHCYNELAKSCSKKLSKFKSRAEVYSFVKKIIDKYAEEGG